MARNLETVRDMTDEVLSSKIEELLSDGQFSEFALAEGLAKKQRLIDRMNRAAEILR